MRDMSGVKLGVGDYIIYSAARGSTSSSLKFGLVIAVLDDEIEAITARRITWNDTWYLQNKGKPVKLTNNGHICRVKEVPEGVYTLFNAINLSHGYAENYEL